MMLDEFREVGNKIPEPLGIHPDAMRNTPSFAITVIVAEKAAYVVRWCWRNKCGGVYSYEQERWTLTTPILFEDFLELLKSRDAIFHEALDSWEARRWIKANKLASIETTE